MPRSCAARGMGMSTSLPLYTMRPCVSSAVDAGEHLHQRRLARAVFAHQRVHLAGQELEPAPASACTPGKALSIPSIETKIGLIGTGLPLSGLANSARIAMKILHSNSIFLSNK